MGKILEQSLINFFNPLLKSFAPLTNVAVRNISWDDSFLNIPYEKVKMTNYKYFIKLPKNISEKISLICNFGHTIKDDHIIGPKNYIWNKNTIWI